MPKRKYTTKKRMTKSRKYTRRKRRYTRYRKPLILGGIPDSKVCRLRYCEFVKLDADAAGSAVAVQHTFNANSVYDPNQSGTGHQPMGYDEMAAQYNHYVVLGSKITVHFDNDVDNVQLAGQYCFLRLDDAVPATNDNLVAMMERSASNIAYKPRNVDTNKAITLTKTFSCKKFFGINKNDGVGTRDDLAALTNGANPAEGAYFTCGVVCSRTTTTNPPVILARVTIDYIVKFYEKNLQPQS
jgi:hypothetical protein